MSIDSTKSKQTFNQMTISHPFLPCKFMNYTQAQKYRFRLFWFTLEITKYEESYDELMVGELVEFEEGRKYIASNLESKNFGVVLMADGLKRKERSSIKAT